MQTDADVEQASGGKEHGWAQLAYGKDGGASVADAVSN